MTDIKVYLLCQVYDYEGDVHLGIFATRERAVEAAERQWFEDTKHLDPRPPLEWRGNVQSGASGGYFVIHKLEVG